MDTRQFDRFGVVTSEPPGQRLDGGIEVEDQGASLIFDLDTTIQSLAERLGRDDPETVKLTGIYHNLIRTWAEV